MRKNEKQIPSTNIKFGGTEICIDITAGVYTGTNPLMRPGVSFDIKWSGDTNLFRHSDGSKELRFVGVISRNEARLLYKFLGDFLALFPEEKS